MMKLAAITFEHVNDNASANAKLEYFDPLNRTGLPLYIRIYKTSSTDLYFALVDYIKNYYKINEVEENRYKCSNDMPYYLRFLSVSQTYNEGKISVTQKVIKLTPEYDDKGFIRNEGNGMIRQKTELDPCGQYVIDGYLEGWLPR